MDLLSAVAFGQLLRVVLSGNSTALPPWVESTSRRKQVFCSSCQECTHSLLDFSALMFCLSLLLITLFFKLSYQQGLLDSSSLVPPSQSPNSCSPASLVLHEKDEVVLGTVSWNFILWTNWCLDFPPTPPITLRCRSAVLSSSTLLHKQVLVVDACFSTWEIFQLGREVGKHACLQSFPLLTFGVERLWRWNLHCTLRKVLMVMMRKEGKGEFH